MNGMESRITIKEFIYKLGTLMPYYDKGGDYLAPLSLLLTVFCG